MARPVPSGTPDRPVRYLAPHTRRRLLLASLVAPVLVLVGAVALYAVGYRRVASPGPLTLHHASVETSCNECHRPTLPHTVANDRCERCHDPRASGRLADAAHARWIPVTERVGTRPATLCAHCHSDHGGRAGVLRTVDSRKCSACHGFSGVARHPEFAVVAAGRRPLRGLNFGHSRHVEEVRRVLGRGCEACHRLSADLATFEPIAFDRHCAACHTQDGVLPAMTDPIPADEIDLSAGTTLQLAVRRPRPDRIVLSGIQHRDPWVLRALARLNRGLATAEDRTRREALARRLASLERARREGPLAGRSTEGLDQLASDLTTTPSTVADVAIAPARVDPGAAVQRLRQQVALELERRAAGGAAPISLAATLSDDRALESAIVATRRQLTELDARLTATPIAPAERAARTRAAQALLVPCLTCHQLQDGTRLAPVMQGAEFTAARFTHAPHVVQVACDTCHSTITTSTAATDVLTPGIQTCQTCHGRNEAPIACTACHQYHPPAEVGLGLRSRAR